MPAIKFSNRSDAVYYRNSHVNGKKELAVKKSRYWSMNLWKYLPCWIVVRK